MKTYTATRSLFGDLGSLRRNQTLNEDDTRIANNPRAVSDLVKRGLLRMSAGEPALKQKPQGRVKSDD